MNAELRFCDSAGWIAHIVSVMKSRQKKTVRKVSCAKIIIFFGKLLNAIDKLVALIIQLHKKVI